jgi:hypothetical protein
MNTASAASDEHEYVRRNDVAIEMVEGEAFVWDARTQELHRLNVTTTMIWNSCHVWSDVPAIAAAVAQGAGSDAAENVADAVEQLWTRQLLRRRVAAI